MSATHNVCGQPVLITDDLRLICKQCKNGNLTMGEVTGTPDPYVPPAPAQPAAPAPVTPPAPTTPNAGGQ